MPNKLVDIKIKEVSGVGSPANMRKFLIVKSAAPGHTLKEKLANIIKQYLPEKAGAVTFTQALAYETMDSQLSDMLYDAHWALKSTIQSIIADGTVTDKIAAIRQALSDFSEFVSNGFQQALNLINFPQNGSSVNKSKEGANVPKFSEEIIKNLPEEVRKELEKIEELEKKAARVEELEKKVEELQKSTQTSGSEEDILKGLPEPVRKMVEEANKRAEEAEEIAKAERETRLKQEYIAKAKQLSALGIKPEEFGLVLKKVAEACPEEYVKLEAVLKAANNAIETSGLFKAYGSNGEGEGSSAWDRIVKKAEEVRKSDPNMTLESAISKVMHENPQLYEEYRKELMS